MPERVYWDTPCFIGRIQPHPQRIAALRYVTDRGERGEVEIVTATWTLCEVCKVDEGLLPEEQERKITEFFENPYILIRQLDRDVAQESRHIVRTYRLKPNDALHVASALLSDCPVLHTYDEQLLKLTEKITRVEDPGSPPLRIERPQPPPQLELEGLGSDAPSPETPRTPDRMIVLEE